LYLYHDFNANSGTTVTDQTSNGRDGTLTNMDGSTAWVSTDLDLNTDLGYALDFDGINDRVVVTNPTGLDNANGTVEMWFKQLDPSTSNRALVTYNSRFVVYMASNFFGVFDQYNKQYHTTTPALNAGAWHHLAFTFQAGVTNGSKLYVDGVLEKTITYNQKATTSTDLVIANNHAFDQALAGKLEELRIWSDVRSQTELKENMKRRLSGGEAGLVAYYDFNSNSGTTLTDQTSNNNDGTLTNMDGSTDWVSSDAWLSASINNAAGYVMMSAPVVTSYSDILNEVWTQGATGADVSNGSSNIWTWDNSSTGTSNSNWTPVSDLGTDVRAGEGFLYYHYNDDNYDSSPNSSATSISVSGAVNANPGITINPNDEAWTLVGNPFASSFDWDNIASSNNIYSNAQVWNPGTSAWVTTSSNSVIAPFQSFFVQTFDPTDPSLNIGEGAKAAGDTFYGKRLEIPKLIIAASSDHLRDEIVIRLHGDAEMGHDRYDASKLTPMNSEFVALSVDKGGSYSVQTVPETDDILEFPLILEKSSTGTVTLSLRESSLPAGYTVELVDLQEDKVYAVNNDMEIEVFIEKADKAAPEDGSPKPLLYESSKEARFNLILISGETTSLEDNQIATKTKLHNNYPNPFNPATTMSYSLPQSAEITLEVFNMMGQRIALIDQGVKPAGMHNAQWNAVGKASGVYFYRLTVNGQALSPKAMTLIK